MGIWSATDKSRKFLEVWLYIYHSTVSHWIPNYSQAPSVLYKHRKSKNSLFFKPVTKLLQLPVTCLQKFWGGVGLPQNHPTQLALIWSLCGGLSMSTIDGALMVQSFLPLKVLRKSQRFCTKNITSVFPSPEKAFRPLEWLQIHLPSFDFLISEVPCWTSHVFKALFP